jgi:hypothetical protein
LAGSGGDDGAAEFSITVGARWAPATAADGSIESSSRIQRFLVGLGIKSNNAIRCYDENV